MPGEFSCLQFAVARSARQMAVRINSGDILTDEERENAFVTFEALAEYVGALTPSEYANMLPVLAPIQKALKTLEETKP